MNTVHLKGIDWNVSGMKDGKGVFMHNNCTISYHGKMEVFLFKQDDNLLLARELRSDCLQDATDCILEAYAASFIPSWEAT